jgi:hypothetical protein
VKHPQRRLRSVVRDEQVAVIVGDLLRKDERGSFRLDDRHDRFDPAG